MAAELNSAAGLTICLTHSWLRRGDVHPCVDTVTPVTPKPNVVVRSNQVQCSWAPFQLQALHSTDTPLNSFGKIRAFGMA